jgi:hypothetical protein
MDWANAIWCKGQVLLGAFGILAYSRRTDQLAIPDKGSANSSALPAIDPASVSYDPGHVAVSGLCDCVFHFGHQSGYPEGSKILAVVEEKLYRPPQLGSYHGRNNGILAQIMTSMIGGEAPLGLVLANSMFKCFWMVKDGNESKMFTYPCGNEFADMYEPEERLLLTRILFHIVRCSVRKETGSLKRPKENKEPRATELDSHQAVKLRKLNAVPPIRQASGQTGAVDSQQGDNFTRLSCIDGSSIHVKPFDMSILTAEEIKAFTRQEIFDRQELRNRPRVEYHKQVQLENSIPLETF